MAYSLAVAVTVTTTPQGLVVAFGNVSSYSAYQYELSEANETVIANVQAAKTAAAVPAPVIPGMAPANNFGGSLSTPSPVTRASRRSRRITVTPVGPVGSFQPGGVGE